MRSVRWYRLFLLGAAASVSLGLSGGAGRTQNGPRAELTPKFRVGEISRYRTTAQTVVTVPVPNQPQPSQTTLDVDLTQKSRVVRGLPQGGGEVESTTSNGVILMNGKPSGEPDSKPVTLTYDARGNLTSVSGASEKANFGGLLGSGTLGMQSAFLPGRPVREGETWQQPLRLPGMPVSGAGTATCRWLTTERVGRYETARIRSFLSQPLKIMFTGDSQPTQDPRRAVYVMTGQLNMTFISNFALVEGKVIRSSGVGGATLTPRLRAASSKNPSKAIAGMGKITLKMRIGYNLME